MPLKITEIPTNCQSSWVGFFMHIPHRWAWCQTLVFYFTANPFFNVVILPRDSATFAQFEETLTGNFIPNTRIWEGSVSNLLTRLIGCESMWASSPFESLQIRLQYSSCLRQIYVCAHSTGSDGAYFLFPLASLLCQCGGQCSASFFTGLCV